MEAEKGIKRKLVCLVLSIAVLMSATPLIAEDGIIKASTHKSSLVWGRYDGWSVVLGTLDGKALILSRQGLSSSKAMLLDIETGNDLWEIAENNLKTFASGIISYIDSSEYLFDVSHGIVIFRLRTDSLVCFEINSGKKLWERKSGDYMFLPKFIDEDVAYEIVLNKGNQKDYQFLTYNVLTGETISQIVVSETDIPRNIYFHGFVYGKIKNWLVLWDEDHVVLFDPAKIEFKHLITTDLISYDDTLCVFDNIIVVNKNYFNPGYLYTKIVAVNADTGKELWNYIICGLTYKIGKYVVLKRKVNDVCELVFVDPENGKIMHKFYDKSVDYIWYTVESGLLKVYYEYKVNKHKNRYVMRAFDDQLREVFRYNSDMSMLVTDKRFNFSRILDENHLLFQTSKIASGKKVDGIVCMKLIESGKTTAKLDQLSSTNSTILLHSWQNLSILANMDEKKTILSINCIDALTGQSYWSNSQNKLSQILEGKKFDALKLSCYEKWICFYKFENGTRSAMACLNIETGKQEWENKKLKDFELPYVIKGVRGYNAFTKEIPPKEQRIYLMSLDDGKFTRYAKLDRQKESFEVLTGNDQRMIVFDGTLAMYHFRTGYQAWRLKTDVSDMEKLKQSFIYGDYFVRPGSDNGKTLAITGCDLYSGKTKWSIQADSVFANSDNLVLATTGFETKADKTFIVVDVNDGKTIKSTKFDNKAFEGFKVKQMYRIGDDYLVLAFKPGFGSRIISFDDGLNQTGLWNFEGKEIVKANQWLGCISVMFANSGTNQIETVSYRLNYQ
ncbi:MAG: PQQ-like beta-propeller repeat protein [Caldisericia bacterium]|nr:PQQ-like beta-propeller repeat protein [Caldisericia bacterium]